MDRMSSLDASFLYLEGPRTPMHISSLAIYEGPAPTDAELVSMLERRLHLVPRFRQRLATVPFGGHRPVWIDDEDFDITAHVQRLTLANGGGEKELMNLTGRILAQPLCRTRPLWEMWLIDGLTHGRFAVLSKTHHCLFDGITGVDLHAVLLDATPGIQQPTPAMVPHRPRPAPNALGLLAGAVRDRVGDSIELARGITRAARDAKATWRDAAEFLRGARTLTASLIHKAPPSVLNTQIGSRRRFAVGRTNLSPIKDLKHTLRASVNDVILASVAGGMRRWQLDRGDEPHDMQVMVPVSVRSDKAEAGNRVAMVVVPLPVSIRDPLIRLDLVRQSMTHARTSGQVEAGDTISRAAGFLPPMAVAGMSQLQARYRSFNLLCTNVPGPQFPLYLLGRRMLELFPQAPLAANQALSIAALSYDGRIGFGLLGDHDSIDDLDVLARGIEDSVDEILWAGGLDTAIAEPSVAQIQSQIADLVSVP